MKTILMKSYLFFISVILLYGCATPPMKPDPEAMKGIKRFGIVSLLGEEIEAKYVGVTAFGNEYFLTPTLDWNLNQKAIEEASKSLKKGGFEVIRIDYDYATMWKKYRESQESYSTRVSEAYGNDTTTPIIKSDLEHLGSQFSVDGFVVIVPGHEGPYCQGGEPCIGYGDYGYGIHNRLNRVFNAYISARIYVIPFKSLKPAAQSQANIHVSIPLSQWKKAFSDFNTNEKQYIQQGLYKSAEQAIPQAIARMGLSPN